ncbi:hypothetical protein COCOBI_03-0660 [Coccomyxa sp. Obi]|nr:hypothetical protein COCOBI_03-0660 [Coccomyxa sp. Obi]
MSATEFSSSVAVNMDSFNLSSWIPPASGFGAAAETVYNMPTAWKPHNSGGDWQVPQRRSPFIAPDDSVHTMIPVSTSRPAAHFPEINLTGPLDEVLTSFCTNTMQKPQQDTSYHQSFPVLNDHMLNMDCWDLENQLDSHIREEECTVGNLQNQWQTSRFQTTKAMDFDSIFYDCQPQPLPTQHTVASPDLSTGTYAQLPPACLPATSPLPSAPLQLEVPPINTATVAVAVSLPRAVQRPRESPELQQVVLPALLHARPAKTRGRPQARGRASAERSAASGSLGRSRSRSPIRDADVAISDVSGNESGSSKVLRRASGDEVQSAKRPAKKNARQTTNKNGSVAKKIIHQTIKKKGAGKKKGSGGKKGGPEKAEKTSKYLGVSFHSLNLKWRTTVFSENYPRHMGYFAKEEDAARRYDEVAVAVWNEKTAINFSIKDYPAKKVLDARWKPILKAKEEKRRKKAEEAARRLQEEAEAELQATGGTITKAPAKVPQKRRSKKSSSYSDSDVTISDASLESLLDDEEGGISSRRSPISVATRPPLPKRKAALQAQQNIEKTMKEHLSDCEQDSDEVPPAPAAACRHARATAAAERRLRASQARGRQQPRNKMSGLPSSTLLLPAMGPLSVATSGLGLEMMAEDTLEDQLLTDLASDPFAESILLAS